MALSVLGLATACTSSSGGRPGPAPTPTDDRIRVPDVVGKPVSTASDVIGRQHLEIEVVRAEVSDLPVATVVRQVPAAGSPTDPNEFVRLTLSAGPHPQQRTLQIGTCDISYRKSSRPCIGGIVIVPIEAPTARAMCDAALPGRARSAEATTLAEVRRTNIGGPPPGLTPGAHAFPTLPGNTPAAWCWTADTSPSPGEGGSWTLYVAVPDGRATEFFGIGGAAEPAPGPPSIP